MVGKSSCRSFALMTSIGRGVGARDFKLEALEEARGLKDGIPTFTRLMEPTGLFQKWEDEAILIAMGAT